jgi:hypothetical protein
MMQGKTKKKKKNSFRFCATPQKCDEIFNGMNLKKKKR